MEYMNTYVFFVNPSITSSMANEEETIWKVSITNLKDKNIALETMFSLTCSVIPVKIYYKGK